MVRTRICPSANTGVETVNSSTFSLPIILFLIIACPISIGIMALLGWADYKQQEERKNNDR